MNRALASYQLIIGTLGFLIGTIILSQLPSLPSLKNLFFLPLILLVFFCLHRSKCPYIYKCLYLMCCAIACGFICAMLHAGIKLSGQIDPAIENDNIILTGRVVSLPRLRLSATRFEFETATIEHAGVISQQSIKILLNWYRKDVSVQPGEHWRLHARLKRPYGFSNPGSFDYEAWLFQRGINATGYVVNHYGNTLLQNSPDNLSATDAGIYINYMRHLLRTHIYQLDIGNFEKNFLLALGIGDRGGITSEQSRILRQTGTSHLLAISGLHISFIAGLFAIIGRCLWSLSIVLPQYLASQRFAIFAGLLGGFIYAALAGFSIPTQRAFLMLAVGMLLFFFNRRFASTDIVALALLSVLLIDPLATMSHSFWLSFMAVMLIFYGMTCRVHTHISKWYRIWWHLGRVQYVIVIGLLPIVVLYFQQYPLVSFFANIVAIPYITLIVIPCTLIGIILCNFAAPVGDFFLHIAGDALLFFWPFLEYLAALEFNLWHFIRPSKLSFIIAFVGVLIILLPKGCPARWIGVFYLLPLLFPQQINPENNNFQLTQLDVGHGLATVIQTSAHALIYDTGDNFSKYFNIGEAVLLPFLRHKRISPDILIISHGDRDHIGGHHAILKNYPEIRVITSVKDKINHPYVTDCVQGMRWHWDGIDFEILSPPGHIDGIVPVYRGNDSSCVLKIGNKKHSVLLPGDIERPAEMRLTRDLPDKLSAKVMIAPHHGSMTSSAISFIDIVKPEAVIFSVGYRNRFGLPNPNIISRYESRQVKILNTARDGALSFKFEGDDMHISSYRRRNWRFWMNEY